MIAQSLVSLASECAESAQPERAIRILERASLHIGKALGENNSETLAAMHQLVLLLHAQGRSRDAVAPARELVRLTPKDDPRYAERERLLEAVLRSGE